MTEQHRNTEATIWIALLALLPILPNAFVGYAGQDFEFHASSWLELRNAWLAGHFAPTWAPMANFTLGDPHLVLYPPISFLLGGFLSLLLPFHLAPAAFLWIALTLAGLSMYIAAKPFVSERDRLPAALLYTLSPYLVTTALVRFAAAELLVQACLPLIVLCFYRTVWERSNRATILLGTLLGLTWLTNIPASLILLYGLLSVAAICAIDQRSPAPILRLLAAETIAGTLAAFYLLPLWFERAFINLNGLVRSDPRRLLLFMPAHGPETLKVFKYSCWIFAVAGVLLILACLRKRSTRLADNPAARTWLYLSIVSIFFQMPFSLWLWNHLPELRAAEFPFRFLPLPGVALPLILFAPTTRRVLRKPVYAVIALLTLSPFLQVLRVQHDPTTRVPPIAQLAQTWQTQGYDGLAEYWPAGIPTRPTPSVAEPNCTVTPAAQSPISKSFRIAASAPCDIEFPILSYPYWHASDESNNPITTHTSPHGLIALTAPSGTHLLRLTFQTASKPRTLGATITFAALLAIALTLAISTFGKLK